MKSYKELTSSAAVEPDIYPEGSPKGEIGGAMEVQP
jgi:hypothetical protein